MAQPPVVPKLYNPTSFASELSPQHKIWAQSVHKTLLFILDQLGVTPAAVGGGHDTVGSVSSNHGSSDGKSS